MEIFDFSECEYSNRNGSYGGAAGDKDGIILNGEPWITKYEYYSNLESEIASFQKRIASKAHQREAQVNIH